MIKLINLTKSFNIHNTQLNILKNLNLSINKSEVVAIVGSSGSGKSTLMGLLAGLDKADSGQIIIDEVMIDKLKSDELNQFRAENISIVFQQFHLIPHLTVLENILFPLEIVRKKKSIDEVTKLLTEVGLQDRLDHKPYQLSGGESQRLALARALSIEPKLLIADEPSGSLDQDTGKKVMNLFFEQVQRNKTTAILVTHDLDLAKQCQSIYKLINGQLEKIK